MTISDITYLEDHKVACLKSCLKNVNEVKKQLPEEMKIKYVETENSLSNSKAESDPLLEHHINNGL